MLTTFPQSHSPDSHNPSLTLETLKNHVDSAMLHVTGVNVTILRIQLNRHPSLIGPIPTGKNASIISVLAAVPEGEKAIFLFVSFSLLKLHFTSN